VYHEDLTGRRFRPDQIAPVARVLGRSRPRHHVQGTVVGGVPVVREIFPIEDAGRHVVAALVAETAVIEHERQRKRSAIYRRALVRLRDLVLEGRLEGGQNIGRLGVHDGVMVIDSNGQIRYVTAVAEWLYRLLGYADSLVDTQLSELDTNEYVAFRAMELGVCLEQRVTEQDRIWIKKAIPLLPAESPGWLRRLPGRLSRPTGAIIVVQDVTEEVRKEQELRVKNAMIQEIHHRVKNNLQTIAALVRLQARRAESPEVIEIFRQTISRILSVAVVHEFLSQDELSVINIHEVTNRILQDFTNGTIDSAKNITLTLEGSKQFLLPAQQATSCALIINELLQNSIEHGYERRDEGNIVVRLLQTDDSMSVEIEDDGEGLPPGFDPQRGGLGLKIVRTLVKEDLKGQFQLENGQGARAVVSFPRWNAENGAARGPSRTENRPGGTP
jgi:two-component sensor histidine kinase